MRTNIRYLCEKTGCNFVSWKFVPYFGKNIQITNGYLYYMRITEKIRVFFFPELNF